ncbi:MAG: NAD-dependent epimerase/dehydratase family protein, partial [Bacteroidales bacterium]|nr:NAD-dependent epimerase/dehydratase family protein [Bacteroidales bacterium]
KIINLYVMKVLVTGGTGFIGQYVLLRLKETEHSIRCLVRKTSDTTIPEKVGSELITGDVTDRSSIKRAVSGTDAVIHLANIYDFWMGGKSQFFPVNVEGTRNVLEESIDANISKIIHISTLGAYGVPDEKPFTENSSPANNWTSLYFESKYQSDNVAWELHHEKKLPLVVVYPSAVTGPGDNKSSGRYLYNMVKGKMPAQVFLNSILTWVDVRDVAEVIVRALEKKGNIGEKYFAGAELLSFAEFNKIISTVSGVSLPRIKMPSWMAMMNAACLTFLADIFKFQPMLGMSNDQMRTMNKGFSADCSKVTRELNIQYTPISKSLEDAIALM